MTGFDSYFQQEGFDYLLVDEVRRPSLDEILAEARAAIVEHAAETVEHNQLDAALSASRSRLARLKFRYERAVKLLPDALKEPIT